MTEIRHASPSDADGLTSLKSHFVLNTHSMFDTTPPTLEQTMVWLERFVEASPYQLLVAVEGDRVIGYAGTSRYRPKPAFDGTVEVSIYLDPSTQARGVGSALYASLFERSERYGTRTYLAGVALPNPASLAFHRKQGFVEVGTFQDYAHKWGRPISSTWLQRTPSASG